MVKDEDPMITSVDAKKPVIFVVDVESYHLEPLPRRAWLLQYWACCGRLQLSVPRGRPQPQRAASPQVTPFPRQPTPSD